MKKTKLNIVSSLILFLMVSISIILGLQTASAKNNIKLNYMVCSFTGWL